MGCSQRVKNWAEVKAKLQEIGADKILHWCNISGNDPTSFEQSNLKFTEAAVDKGNPNNTQNIANMDS
jgi:hypothetical protein